MSLSGTINSVSLVDVTQLIGLTRMTGTLSIITDRGRFAISFRTGFVVGASAYRFSPHEVGTPISQLYDQERHVRALSAESSADLKLMAGKIVNLDTGYFSFQQGEVETDTGAGLEVSSLLLDSCRQFDEEARDRLIAAENDRNGAPTAPSLLTTSLPDERSEQIQLYEVFKQLPRNPSPGDLSWLILQAARKVFARSILFLVTETDLQGIGGFGHAPDAGKLNAALALIRVPRGVPSLLEDVVDAMALGTGAAEAQWWSSYIPKEFGPMPEGVYVAMPVVAGDECMMVLYGDTFAHQGYEDDLRALEVLNRYVGTVLENQRLRRQLTGAKTADAPSPVPDITKPKQWTN